MGILAAFTAMLPAVYHGSRDHPSPPAPAPPHPHPILILARARSLLQSCAPRPTLACAAPGTTTRATADPTEYFLTCLHLLVNVGMACKDLVLSSKVSPPCQPLPPAVPPP